MLQINETQAFGNMGNNNAHTSVVLFVSHGTNGMNNIHMPDQKTGRTEILQR